VTSGSLVVEVVEVAEDEVDVVSLVVVGSAIVVDSMLVVITTLVVLVSALVVVSAAALVISITLIGPVSGRTSGGSNFYSMLGCHYFRCTSVHRVVGRRFQESRTYLKLCCYRNC